MIDTPAYKALKAHQLSMRERHLKDMFANDAERFDKFCVEACGITLDYSKNRASDTTMGLLMSLAQQSGLKARVEAMFAGDVVNTTEQRAVLHTALRQQHDTPLLVDNVDVIEQVRQTLAKMKQFCHQVHQAEQACFDGQAFSDIICLGIGGSFLGPKIVYEALKPYHLNKQQLHFVANVDGSHLNSVLSSLDPNRTMVIIASKSFSTQETMRNAQTVKSWLVDAIGEEGAKSHMVALSSNEAAVASFGIDPQLRFPMWDWVGGRYSLWSAIGLPIALAIGFEQFEQLLQGGYDMDQHFLTAPMEQNMPVIMALLGIWDINFWQVSSHCIIPYCHYLRGFPAHIQQLDMESNGKSVTFDGKAIDYYTGPAIWGSEGVNSQHAFFQQIHQSNAIYPVDFILPLSLKNTSETHHDMLVAHCFAQSRALMLGKTTEQAYQELKAQGLDDERCHALAPHKAMAGNKPNNVLLLEDLSPRTLGSLLALYEHKVVAQGFIWQINSFDQWGVELGKQLSGPIHRRITIAEDDGQFDCSTEALIARYLKRKKSSA